MFKYLISDCTDPYINLATEEALFNNCQDYSILFLWQNDNTIVIGRNQDPQSECLLDEFLKAGGQIARRRSGGGAVYHDLGNLCYSLIGAEDTFSYETIIIDALRTIGIKTEHNGRNDFTVDGKKFSGNASYVENEKICQHGTIMVSSDIERMNRFLTPNKEKLNKNSVASVRARVINLQEIKPSVTIVELQKALIKVTNATELAAIELSKGLSSGSKNVDITFYKSHDWIYGGIR